MGACCSCCKIPQRKCTDFKTGDEGIFFCDGKCDPDNGRVWGSGPYTSDGDVCRAARHAGVIGATGGIFKVTSAPGQDSYEASTANGVTTSAWGSYGKSIIISKFM